MSDQEVQTGEVDEAEKVLDVVFPSGDKSAEVVHPRKEPLHSPAPAVASQLTGILTPAAVAPVGRDHLDAVLVLAPGQSVLHEPALGR